jgi:hypothetical protein
MDDLRARDRRKFDRSSRTDSALWRLFAGALVQILACLAHRDPGPAGGGADAGDRRVRGVLPEVVGLPRGNFV